MIYNFAEYLRNKLSDDKDSLSVKVNYANLIDGSDNKENILVLVDTGGQVNKQSFSVTKSAQIRSISKHLHLSKYYADAVYKIILGKNNIMLPSLEVDGITYPALKVENFLIHQTPSFLDIDNNYNTYVFNVSLILGFI